MTNTEGPMGIKKARESGRPGQIQVTIDTSQAMKAMNEVREAFENLKKQLSALFIEWLESPEGQRELRKFMREFIRDEVKKCGPTT